jgi:chaperonin GroES
MGQKMKLNPIGERVIVQYKKTEQKKGTLILPNEEQPQFATVIDIGHNDIIGLEIGDLVLLNKYAGIPAKIDNETYLVVEMKDIIAFISEQENE